MRIRKTLAATGLVLALLAVFVQRGPAVAAEKPPEDNPKDIFGHSYHVTEQQLPCADCHPRPFMKQRDTARAKGEFDHAAFDQGRACGSCHNANFAFATTDKQNCERCHKDGVPERLEE